MFFPLLIAGCGVEDPDAWRAPLEHESRPHAIQIVPPVALPKPTAQSDVEVWLSIPQGSVLGGAVGDWVYPAGTIVDRVEFRETSTGRRVVDVRGTTFDARGERWHHVYRPTNGDPDAPLRGARWPANDPSTAELTKDELMESLASLGVRRTGSIRSKLDCNSCHTTNRADNQTRGEFGLVARGTDSSGFFTMPTQFRDDAPLESYGVDPNLESAFVSVTCKGGARPAVDTGTARCPGGEVPRATRDVRAATQAGDAYTLSVLASRRAVLALSGLRQ